MPRPTDSARPQPRVQRRAGTIALALLLILPGVAAAKNCVVGSPAFGVVPALWGTLKPADTGQLPDPRDSSNYNGTQRPDDTFYKVPLFTSIDIENGWIFQSYTQGFKVWDATGGNAANPVLTATRDCQGSGFLRCLPGQHELRELFWDVDAPDGVDSVVALASAPLGMMVMNTSAKGNPVQTYQDYNLGILQVWSATIGGRHWAFAATEGATVVNDLGIRAYDLTAALSANGCIDEPNNRSCNVFKGRIGSARAVSYIDGFRRSDGQFFLAASPGGPGGLEIFNLSSQVPGSITAAKVATLFDTEFIYGTAIWEQAGKVFVAVQYVLPRGAGQGARIVDVTGCLNGGTCSPTTVWSKTWKIGAARHFTTYSKSGNSHFLYFGNEDKCSPGRQREWLFDATNLGSGGQPIDLTPPQTITVSNDTESQVVDYWSWYYAGNPSGFSEVMPRMGKVNGTYFYRAAWTIFDIHEITGGLPPTASFSWSPTEIYPGTNVTFDGSASSGATSFSWTFPDGNASGSLVTRSFASHGTKEVRLEVGNAVGNAAVTKNVLVLNPAPAAGSLSAQPNPALVCQDVALTASGFTGAPPLTYSWEVLNAGNTVVDSQAGVGLTSFSWDNTASQAPGSYTARVTVSNGTATTAQASTAVQLNSLPPLAFNGAPTCTNCSGGPPPAPPAGSANLSIAATGATRWDWDLNGDGDFADPEDLLGLTDPVQGPAPTALFTSTGTKTIRVRVSNCQNLGGIVSDPLTIQVTQINPLGITTFAAGCNFNPCEFVTNQPVAFTTQVAGDPTTYRYDWDGNGSYDETASSPVASHTYTQTTASPICPKLRIERGSEFKEATVSTCFRVVTGAPPPPPPTPTLSINGPASGQINQALSFTASASNCTPSAIWSWNGGGGTVSGSGNAVTITWATAGAKTISVTNSGCATAAAAAKSVSITDPGSGGGGGLTANFTYSPVSPQAGQPVTFTSTSTGSPTIISWAFGDGATGSGGSIAHTYAAPGSYNVRLDVNKPGCPDQLLGLCTATLTKTVVVAGGPPPLQASIQTSASCINEFGVDQCTAERGATVQLTGVAPGATSFSWDFGDGTGATGAQVSHAWTAAGVYQVKLTASNAQSTANAARRFVITAPPAPPAKKSVVLPWIAQTKGALNQTSDLYVHNPSGSEIQVILEWRRRGAPEDDPPRVTRTIGAHKTLYFGDVVSDLFQRETQSGFLAIVVEQGDVEPVITSYNTTFQNDGSELGQSIGGVSTTSASTPISLPETHHLIGLNDDTERLAYFGLTNPSDEPATYRLRFFDRSGNPISESGELKLSRFGQRQFQLLEIRNDFGVAQRSDYRIEVESTEGGRLFPYGANLRLSSGDPSFVEPTTTAPAKSYLIGVLSTQGLNNSVWQTDLVLANVGDQTTNSSVSFTSVGFDSTATPPVQVTLAAGESERLENVLATQLGVSNAVGVVTIISSSAGELLPVVQGESYDNANPAKRFGQSMSAVSDADAATAGEAQLLVGLRQDAKSRTTFWLFNPGDALAECDVIYRRLDGSVLGTLPDVRLGAGKSRQLSPAQHPLPAAGVADGFTVEVVVESGKVLAAAQVINNLTNDPAYIQGETR